MRNQPLQPIDRYTTPRGRRGWLSKLGGDIVERKLDAATQRLVRQEKFASALIISARIARELKQPLDDLEWHIAMLEQLVEREPEIRQVLAGLRQDRQAIVSAVQRLGAIKPPTGVVV